jgi:hypothetical protein
MEPVTVVCGGACTVTHVVNVTGGLDAEQMADLMTVWGLFLVAAVTVLCAKAIYNRFRIDHGEA